jgi:hypothetical protein
MRRLAPFLGAILALVLLAVIAVRYQAAQPKPKKPLTVADKAHIERSQADVKYGTQAGKALYQSFVDKWASSPDPKIQDEVGAARLRLAFMSARGGDYPKARDQFVQTAALYKGTGAMGKDFGGIKDQALYEAAVCLVGEGKKAEARAKFIQFMQEQPLSPLVNAAYRRIVRLDGKPSRDLDALLQHDIDKQTKFVKFEASVCGPKAIAYVLEATKGQKLDYKQLAKECGTDDKGTSLDGMRACLKSHGETYTGLRLNRRDFAKMPLPAILLASDHYLVVTKVDYNSYSAYNSIYGQEEKYPLPSLDSPDFTATVLARPEALIK